MEKEMDDIQVNTIYEDKQNGDVAIADDVVVENIAEQLDSHPMSDITFVLREAGRMAVKNHIEYINQMCFDKALDMLPKKEEKRKIGFNQ